MKSSRPLELKKNAGHRIYLTAGNLEWLEEELPVLKRQDRTRGLGLSTAVNQALKHFRSTLLEDVKVADRRFNPAEMEVMAEAFRGELVPWYYANLRQFYLVLDSLDENKVDPCKHWKKAVKILRRHSTLAEINAVVYRSKF